MLNKRIRDFRVNHRMMVVDKTEQMKSIYNKMTDLSAEYRRLEEAEQKKEFSEYKRTLRKNAARSPKKELEMIYSLPDRMLK